MSRSARLILLAAFLMVVVAGFSYVGAKRLCANCMTADDLAWLKREFLLSDSELAHIRELHQGYLPRCREMCAKIAAKQSEVEQVLGRGETPDDKLVELATLRAQCQAQMLKHFQEVSRAMPAEQGKRYLSEMQRLTLGFHQQFESSMGAMPDHQHMHGDH
jgi:hypothetical protein